LLISWKDKVTNKKVRELAQHGILEDTIKEKRHVMGGTCDEDVRILPENCQTSYQPETDRWQKTFRLTSYRLAANSQS